LIADFACLEVRLIVELDGPVHEERYEQDEQRADVLRSLGCHLVRFDNAVVIAEPGRVLDAILAELGRSAP
jgi:very-short-patch-repair endonuclease